VGCGAGEILKQLQEHLGNNCVLWGYEISPQAFELCQSRVNDKLHFKLADFTQERDVFFEIILLMDVIEHLEDYFSFLRAIQLKGQYKLLHIPLDLTVNTVLSGKLNRFRENYGHLHHFTKDIALQMLNEVGYEVLDYFYTPASLELPAVKFRSEVKRRLLGLPRRLAFVLNEDLAARLLGGWALMVLAK
jgi:cyclopropane fatty-acyl-phospholipid synthase-like methyltransferase